ATRRPVSRRSATRTAQPPSPLLSRSPPGPPPPPRPPALAPPCLHGRLRRRALVARFSRLGWVRGEKRWVRGEKQSPGSAAPLRLAHRAARAWVNCQASAAMARRSFSARQPSSDWILADEATSTAG